ncbi:MAG: FlgD immunoglobulin-like domain containing protein, partial [Fidelibacterota bacterium]
HEPLTDTEDTLNNYMVTLQINSVYPIVIENSNLFYVANSQVSSTNLNPTVKPDSFYAEIEAQPAGTKVDYWFIVVDSMNNELHDPNDSFKYPYAGNYSFYVGPDTIPPEISHSPIPPQPLFNWPVAVKAVIKDNVGIDTAFVEFSKNLSDTLTFPLTPSNGKDNYSGTFPGGVDSGDVIYYRIKAIDASSSANMTVVPEEGFYEFEILPGGYKVTGHIFAHTENQPFPGASIYWGGPIDPSTGEVQRSGELISGSKGEYTLFFQEGIYVIEPHAEGFRSPPAEFISVPPEYDDLNFTLFYPEMNLVFDKDSISMDLTDDEKYLDTIIVRNTGSGTLLFSGAEWMSYNKESSRSSMPADILKFLRYKYIINNNLREIIQLKNIKTSSKVRKQPVDSLWIYVFEDPGDNPKGYDLKGLYTQTLSGNFYLKIDFWKKYTDIADFQVIIFLDSDNDPSTGLELDEIGIDHLIAIGDFTVANGVLLRWNSSTASFDFVGFPSYDNVNSNTDYMEVGFPLSSLLKPTKINLIYLVQGMTDPLFNFDLSPDDNLGWLTLSTEDSPWLKVEPLFGLLKKGYNEQMPIYLAISGKNLTSGVYRSALVIESNQLDSKAWILPIEMNYITGVSLSAANVPLTFRLDQNYPNPFNPFTEIRYQLPVNSEISLVIYDIMGRRVKTLAAGEKNAGYYWVKWDGKNDRGKNVASGLYILRMKAGDFLRTRKMLLLR